jgi:hypothetical protein
MHSKQIAMIERLLIIFFHIIIVNGYGHVRVVILGVRRLKGGRNERAGTPAHYIGRELGVLDIFSKYSLKIPRIYLNMLEYIRIYSIFPCRAGAEVLRARRASRQSRRASRRTNNPGHSIMSHCNQAVSVLFECFSKKKLCYIDFR